jgi:enoyl-[acyl-carrier protein] reductase II
MLYEDIFQRGSGFLKSRYPIMGGAMSWLSNHALTAAISNAGGFGVLASGAMTPELLRAEIEKTQKSTDKSFAVNLIVMHPQLETMMDQCFDVSHVVFAGGIPSDAMIKKMQNFGCKVIGFAPALSFAKRLIKFGIDALIIEGHEAGGHIGPVSTSVLVQEILPSVDEVPVFVAGGIGTGQMIASYMKMGAAGCQLGTRFVCAHESPAHPDFKSAFIKARARDCSVSIQLDPRFPVIPVRAIENHATKNFLKRQAEVIKEYESGAVSLKDAQLLIEHFWAGSLRRAAIDGDVENGSLMAGQSVAFVKKEQSCQEIIDELFLEMKVTP